jgi:hypothetical protein
VLAYFTPFRPIGPARARGCLTCTHFQGRFYCAHLLCERDKGVRSGNGNRVLMTSRNAGTNT